LLLFSFTSLLAKDVIILKSGSKIEGTILSMTAEKVVIERKDVSLEINADNIEEVIFDNTDDIKDTPALGITLGYPASINITASYSSNYFTTRLSGMFYGDAGGIQAIIGYPIYGSKKAMIAPSFHIGTSEGISLTRYRTYDSFGNYFSTVLDETYSYYGPGLDIHFYGFTAFIGYGIELEENIHGKNFARSLLFESPRE